MQRALSLRNFSKWFSSSGGFETRCVAVDKVTLDVGENEFLAMVGPSGCGKSTLLRLIAGLEKPTSGEIYVRGRQVDEVQPRDRNIGFMFQGYALFKHMTVARNIEFGLKVRKVPRKVRQQRVEELVSLMGLEGLEGRKPNQLSGGQQQRVALARALAPRPQLLLLDEPFGAVDAKVRQRLRADTKKWQRELKIPTILVTHDQREALELGDRVAVMNKGRFEQIDTPRNVYDRPASEFVARFIGRVNVFRTKLEEDFDGLPKEAQFEVMVRPEDISIRPWDNGRMLEEGRVLGTIVGSAFLGRTVRLEVQMKNERLVTVALPKHEALANNLSPGRTVALSMNTCQVFTSGKSCLEGTAKV